MSEDELIEKMARAIWKNGAININGTRDLDAEFSAFSAFDKSWHIENARAVLSLLPSLGLVMVPVEGAAHDILAERKRQISEEEWTTDHDDAHNVGELARASSAYAYFASLPDEARILAQKEGSRRPGWISVIAWIWPWSFEWWKPSDRRRDLVKAGALILAEIERLDRSSPFYKAGERP